MSKSCEIMNEIMGAIIDTEEWRRIQYSDPMIQKTERELKSLLEQVGSPELEIKLSDACSEFSSAIADAAILYGIQVANAIRIAVDDPSIMSRFYLERMEKVDE